MIKGATYTGLDLMKEATAREPWGPGFTEAQARGADALEIWHGDGYIEYRLTKDGKPVKVKTRLD